MWLGVFIGAVGLRQLACLIIYIVVALRRSVDAIGPVQTGVKPLRRVRGGTLCRQHIAHLVEVGFGIGFGGKVATFPAPIAPGTCQTVKDLRRRGFTAKALILRQLGQGFFIGNRAPQERRNALLANFLHTRRHTCFAEVFLSNDVRRNLTPVRRH